MSLSDLAELERRNERRCQVIRHGQQCERPAVWVCDCGERWRYCEEHVAAGDCKPLRPIDDP